MRLQHIFFDVHMANGHAGLVTIMKKEKKKLRKNDCATFINTTFDTVKILVGDGQFLVHYKHPSGKIAPETIKDLPNFINGGELQYTKALRKVIYEKLPQKKKVE